MFDVTGLPREKQYEVLRDALSKLESQAAFYMQGSPNSRAYKDAFQVLKDNCALLALSPGLITGEKTSFDVLYDIAYSEWQSKREDESHWSKVMRAIAHAKPNYYHM